MCLLFTASALPGKQASALKNETTVIPRAFPSVCTFPAPGNSEDVTRGFAQASFDLHPWRTPTL